MDDKELKEKIRNVKQRFFMMRNGAVGEQMRRAGADYRINFGLNLPQIVEIARDFGPDVELADALWQNRSTRESMLIAPMLYPRGVMSVETARKWVSEVPSVEIADILCHRLLKNEPFAFALATELLSGDVEEPLQRYVAIRLMFNLLTPSTAQDIRPFAEAEAASDRPTATVARMLLGEIEWLED